MNPREDNPTQKHRVLGKGLSALIQGADLTGVPPLPPAGGGGVAKIPLANIGVNPHQPRKIFNDNDLRELADSIRQVGILQPVLLRRLQSGERAVRQPGEEGGVAPLEYCVVAGERRCAPPVCWACALFMWAKRRAPRAAVQRGFAMLALGARPLALSPANALSLRNLKHPQTFSAFKTPRRTKGPCAFGF